MIMGALLIWDRGILNKTTANGNLKDWKDEYGFTVEKTNYKSIERMENSEVICYKRRWFDENSLTCFKK